MVTKDSSKTGKGKPAFGGKQAKPFGQKDSEEDKAEDEQKQAKAQQRKTRKGGRAKK